MRPLLILLAALAAPAAHAIEAPTTIGVHVATAHSKRGYNDVNPGLYARWANGFTLGTYRNSEWRQSAYAGWTFSDHDDRFALTVGLITGYKRARVLPLLAPSVRIPLASKTSVRLTFLPPAEKGTAAIHLSLERRF